MSQPTRTGGLFALELLIEGCATSGMNRAYGLGSVRLYDTQTDTQTDTC